MRPKVQLVTAVWGKSYIKGFLNLSIRSSLAPNNLPALAESTDLEYVILTTKKDVKTFAAEPQFAKLQQVAKVKFLFIDDLIVKHAYGVVLTLAYFMAIKDMGKKAKDTFFVFMNSDFILADGSLRTLIPYFQKGAHVVLAPSFRASEEAVLSELHSNIDTNKSTLSIPPRQLAGMALRNQHATVIAKTFNQPSLKSLYPNNLYWKVDNTTMLGRYFLLFMLVIRPQRLPERAVGFCDYSFVPEFCPDAEAEVITDSDDFFMLELQTGGYESEHIAPGINSSSIAIRSLEDWTTAEHRRYSRHTLVFHSADLPPDLEEQNKKFDALLQEIETGLDETSPRDHADHYYWHGAVYAWLREQGELTASMVDLIQPTLSAHGARGGRISWLTAQARRLEKRLALSQLDMTSKAARAFGVDQFLDRALDQGGLLYVSDDHYLDATLLRCPDVVDKRFTANVMAGSRPGTKPYHNAVCVFSQENLHHAESTLQDVLARLRGGGELLVLYHRDTAITSGFFSYPMNNHHLNRVSDLPLEDSALWWTSGNKIICKLLFLFARCAGQVRSRRLLALVGGAILAPVAIYVYPWLLGRGRRKGPLPRDVSTFFFKGRKIDNGQDGNS